MISFACSQCQQPLQSNEDIAGLQVKCPACGEAVMVPSQAVRTGPPPLPPGFRESSALSAEPPPLPDRLPPPNDDVTIPDDRDDPRLDDPTVFDDLPGDLPEELDELGGPRALFKPSAAMQYFLIVLGPLICLGGLWLILIDNGRVVISEGRLLGLLVVFAGAGLLSWYGVHNLGLRLAVFAHGMLYIHGSKTEIIRWTDIDFVWQAITDHYTNFIYTGTTHVYTIQLKNGKRHVFQDKFQHVKELGETIQREVTVVLLPRMIDAFQRGERVLFGPLGVDRYGLTHGQSFLPWEEIEQLKLEQGVIVVSKRGKWFSWGKVGVSQVPNLVAFLVLTNNILGVNR